MVVETGVTLQRVAKTCFVADRPWYEDPKRSVQPVNQRELAVQDPPQLHTLSLTLGIPYVFHLAEVTSTPPISIPLSNLAVNKTPLSAIMPPHGGEIPYEKRVAVICLRLLFGFTYATIGEKLDLKIRSVHQVYSRAMRRTEEHLRNSFVEVAKNVRDAPRSGRPATGRSKRKPRASRAKGQAPPPPAESAETRPEVPGGSAEEQRPLLGPGQVNASGPVSALLGSDAGNRESPA